MELTYDNMLNHMKQYFADYNKYGGDPETLPKMLKYYVPEILLYSFTLNSADKPLNLEAILGAMTHPGLHEEFTVFTYVVDEKSKVVVVDLTAQFTEEAIKKTYPAKHISVHYYLKQDEKKDIKIYKIFFFPQAPDPKDVNMMPIMKKYRESIPPEKRKII
jgi:hypothetical protein